MAHITSLPAELILKICDNLENDSFFSFRRPCHDVKRKVSYKFAKFFRTVKISFCLASVHALVHISKDETIANSVLHITIGTETLGQYPCIPDRSESDEMTEERRAN